MMNLDHAKYLANTVPSHLAGSYQTNAYTYARAAKALLQEVEALEKLVEMQKRRSDETVKKFKWQPASQPPDNICESVLVMHRTGHYRLILPAVAHRGKSPTHWWCEDQSEYIEVVAWMPIPAYTGPDGVDAEQD